MLLFITKWSAHFGEVRVCVSVCTSFCSCLSPGFIACTGVLSFTSREMMVLSNAHLPNLAHATRCGQQVVRNQASNMRSLISWMLPFLMIYMDEVCREKQKTRTVRSRKVLMRNMIKWSGKTEFYSYYKKKEVHSYWFKAAIVKLIRNMPVSLLFSSATPRTF